MERNAIIALALSSALVGVGSLSASAADDSAPAPSASTSSAAATVSVSDDAKADLAFARDEERISRDLYQLLADKYDQARPFSNIVRSESRHFDAIGTLLQRYGVADPAAGKSAGSYANADLQKLYDGWKAQGSVSLAEAYKAAIALETRDIADLKKAVNNTTAADMKAVYTHLLRGSENHLRAFTAAAEGKTGGNGTGLQQGQQGQQQGTGCQGQCHGRQGMGMGKDTGKNMGRGGGYGRTGQRPADCPLATQS